MHHDPISDDSDSKWQVMVGPGDVRTWDLDQLDAAYKAGVIDESVRLCEVGGREWMTLGDLLGDDAGSEPVPASTAPVTYTPMAPPAALASSQYGFGPASAPAASLAPAAMSVRPAPIPSTFDGAPPQRRGATGSRVAQGVFAVACAAVVAVGGLSGAKLATLHKGPIAVSGAAVQALTAAPPEAPAAAPLPVTAAEATRAEGEAQPPQEAKVDAPPAYVPGRHVVHESKKPAKAAPAKRPHAKSKKAAKAASTGANEGAARFDPLNGEL